MSAAIDRAVRLLWDEGCLVIKAEAPLAGDLEREKAAILTVLSTGLVILAPPPDEFEQAFDRLVSEGALEVAGTDPNTGEPTYRLTEKGQALG